MDTYFPILIKISSTGEERVVEHYEIPVGVAFTVLKTNVNIPEQESCDAALDAAPWHDPAFEG